MSARSSAPARILLVEDDPDIAESLLHFFVAAGYDVRLSADALQALVACDLFKPDLAIVDVHLPDNAYNLANQMRSRLDSGIFLIAIAPRPRKIDREREHTSGFDHHFTAPGDLDVMLSVIANRRPALAS